MIGFFVQFIPFLLLSYVVVRFAFRKRSSLKKATAVYNFILIVIALIVFRSFIMAMWMLNQVAFLIFMAAIIVLSIIKAENPKARLAYFVKAFLLTFPIYLTFAVFFFSVQIGHNCEKMKSQKGIIPIFSLCDSKNKEIAEGMTKDVYHCRNAFMGWDRRIMYGGFGAETNPRVQPLIGVAIGTGEVVRKIFEKTIFRAWCHPRLGDCVFLASPANKIIIWDDKEQKIIKDYYFENDRPRFLSVDEEKPVVYVASDGDWIAYVDLEKKRKTREIKAPTGALLTIANTRKHIIATVNLPFRPVLVFDKNTGKVSRIVVGRSAMWKSLGFFFNATADYKGERAFVEAPFECAVYMIDLKEKKTKWKYALPIGVRDITYDSKRKMIYAANFVNGYVYKIDVSGAKPRGAGSFFLGRRLRYLNYEKDLDIVLSAGSNGFIAYDPKNGLKRDILKRHNMGKVTTGENN